MFLLNVIYNFKYFSILVKRILQFLHSLQDNDQGYVFM